MTQRYIVIPKATFLTRNRPEYVTRIGAGVYIDRNKAPVMPLFAERTGGIFFSTHPQYEVPQP